VKTGDSRLHRYRESWLLKCLDLIPEEACDLLCCCAKLKLLRMAKHQGILDVAGKHHIRGGLIGMRLCLYFEAVVSTLPR
jgi:hypothetical protein